MRELTFAFFLVFACLFAFCADWQEKRSLSPCPVFREMEHDASDFWKTWEGEDEKQKKEQWNNF